MYACHADDAAVVADSRERVCIGVGVDNGVHLR